MSSPTSHELLADRIKFRFYAAEKHLGCLKDLEVRGETIREPDSRIKMEIEIEDLLSHLIGAIDSLLVRIYDKLNLGVGPGEIRLRTINDKLDSKGTQDILKDLNDLLNPTLNPKGSWNQAIVRRAIQIMALILKR